MLVKRPKPGQDLRFDMPAIGPDTLRAVAAAGLKGIEIAAGGVLLLGPRGGAFRLCREWRRALGEPVTLRLFLVAGEASGDRLGAALIRGLREVSGQELELHGIGGPLMEAEGLTSLFPMEELSVMGLTEILPRLRSLLARVSQTAEAVLEIRPDALITIDSPEFSLRVAAKVKARAAQVPTIHYVAPTVWAWRPKRARKMAKSIDHVLALFPFEPPYMEAEGDGLRFRGPSGDDRTRGEHPRGGGVPRAPRH